eukprot:TRINITY_DN12783_c0_g1_i1.p1 TRINITY_DN12783_c0_g1~~TRINITY_DN12783_c0_g1_i1.p1  ORF type:complete len:493 (+),score=134.54 TRINITY_DN12783_c0_g1_i1:100-1578(+)
MEFNFPMAPYPGPPYGYMVPPPPFNGKEGNQKEGKGGKGHPMPYGMPFFHPNGQTPPNGMFPGRPFPVMPMPHPQFGFYPQFAGAKGFPMAPGPPGKIPPELLAQMKHEKKLQAKKKAMREKEKEMERRAKLKEQEKKEAEARALANAANKEGKEKKPRTRRKKNSLYCICQKPEEAGQLMVGCDNCNNWFHPECVNLTKRIAKQLDHFICPNCRPNVPAADVQQYERTVEELTARDAIESPKRRKKSEDSPDADLSPASEPSPPEEKPVKEELNLFLDQVEEPVKQEGDTEGIPGFRYFKLKDEGQIKLSTGDIFNSPEKSEELKDVLVKDVPWIKEYIPSYGAKYLKLSAYYGDTPHSCMKLLPWTPTLTELKERVEKITKTQFNFVQLNYFRDGEDYLGFREEQDHFKEPLAILALGSHRNFIIKHAATDEVLLFPMPQGTLLVFQGENSLKNYMVSTPKMKGLKTGRIVLTFKNITAPLEDGKSLMEQ